MSDEQRQRISELQDGELGSAGTAHLFDAVGRETDLRGVWERYHLIGLAIRGEPVVPEHRGIADAVRERVRSEPTVLAPRGPAPQQRRPLKRAAGMALAAAAAFVAVFVAPALLDRAGSLQTGPAAQPGFAALSPAAQIPAMQAPATQAPAKRWDLDRPELADKLDLYLVTHQVAAPTAGAKGMLPYATFVGYESGR